MKMAEIRIKDMSFEVLPGWEKQNYPECDDVQCLVDKTVESYWILKKAGKFKDAKEMRGKIIETMYAKEHLKIVMNMNFQRPTEKMRKLAKEHNIDVTNPAFIEDFMKIQKQSL